MVAAGTNLLADVVARASSEAAMREAFEHLPVGVGLMTPVLDEHGAIAHIRVDYNNSEAASVIGVPSAGEVATAASSSLVTVVGGMIDDAWTKGHVVRRALDRLDDPEGDHRELMLQRIGDRLMITCLDRTDEMRAVREVAHAAKRQRSIVESLTQAVFVFEPVLDGGRVIDLRLVEANRAAHRQALWECTPGLLASTVFTRLEAATNSAQRVWDGEADEPYEIRRPGNETAGNELVLHVSTVRVDDLIMQVVFDRTVEHHLLQSEDRYRSTADLLAQPMHLHRPILDDAGQLVDTEIVFANRAAELIDDVGVPHAGRRSSAVFADDRDEVVGLYRSAWFDPDGPLHTMTVDNLDGWRTTRPSMYLEVQARRVGELLLTVAVDRTEAEIARRESAAASAQLTAIFEALSEGVLVADAAGKIVAANHAAVRIGGLSTTDDLVGRTIGTVGLEIVGWDGVPIPADGRAALLQGGLSRGRMFVRVRHADGSVVSLVFRSRPFDFPDGSVGALITASDVTDVQAAHAETELAEFQFRTAMEAIGKPVLLLEGDGAELSVVYANRAAEALGCPDLVTADDVRLLDLEVPLDLANALLRPAPYRGLIGVPGPRPKTFEVSIDPAGDRRVAVFRDVTVELVEAAVLEHMTRHDPTSGLPNRRGLDLHLAQVMSDLDIDRRSVAVIVVDVDQMAEVQRGFGFSTADQLVVAVVDRLRDAVDRAEPTRIGAAAPFVAQLSGSSFAIVIDAAERAASLAFAAGVVQSLGQPVTIEGVRLHVEASAGVVFAPLHGHDFETLVMRSKAAAWGARHRRVPVFVWQPEVDRDRVDRMQLLADLDRGLRDDELVLEFQPKVNLRTGAVVGAEVLVRWNHPTLGQLSPSRFIAEVEESTLATRFTQRVLERSLAEWMGIRPPSGARLSVNVPPSVAADPALPAMVEDALVMAGATPDVLELEITERGFIGPSESVLSNMSQLTSLGVHFAIDDFGAGQASLGYLRHLPVQAVKIDQGFVRDLASDAVNRSIVAACVGVASALGIQVVAEGLEHAAEVAAAIELGCGFGQGFHIARPVPIERFTADLADGGPLVWC